LKDCHRGGHCHSKHSRTAGCIRSSPRDIWQPEEGLPLVVSIRCKRTYRCWFDRSGAVALLEAALLGWVLAAVAGIMVSISLDELVPVAKSSDTECLPIVGLIAGMLLMAISPWMLK
jgi:hypothetical protein